MKTSVCLRGGQVLTPQGDLETADLHIAEGRIVGSPAAGSIQIDCRGLHVLPGIVDVHGDAFELELHPRPGVDIAFPIAMGSVDRQLLANGITTAFHGLTQRARLRAGEWIVVYGCGGVGLSAIEIATCLGAHAIAVDIGADKLALAEELGAVATINAAEVDDPASAVMEMTSGGAQVSLDALGIQQTCENAIRSLTKRGRHLQIGMTSGQDAGRLKLPVDDVINKELDLCGSKGMPAQNFPSMLRLVAAGRLDPARLVTKTVPLEEAGDVLASMGDFDTLGFTVIDRF